MKITLDLTASDTARNLKEKRTASSARAGLDPVLRDFLFRLRQSYFGPTWSNSYKTGSKPNLKEI